MAVAAAGPTEQLLATLHVEHSTGDGSIAAGVVEAAARQLGLTEEQAAHLALATRSVARAVYARGFDDPSEAAIDVTVLRSGHQLVVRVDDLGLPFNAAVQDALDLDVIEGAVRGGWIDAITHESRGREGNRTELVRHLDPGIDLRDVAGGERAGPPVDPAPIPADAELVSRMGTPEDAEGICRLTWRTYGGTYQHDEYYQPDRLAAMIADGLQASFVVACPDGEIIGHSAVLLEHPDDVVVEGGRAMVDPRFRGHHLMGAARDLRSGWLREHGILALEGAAVTAHTRSQTDRPVMSIQLGFLPPIVFRGIEGTAMAHREAVAGGIFPVAPIPSQRVALPRRDAEMIMEIYRQSDLPRAPLATTRDPAARSRSHLALEARGDLGHAVITCDRIGADLALEVRQRVEAVGGGGIEVVYADVPLDRPAAPWAAEVLNREGFIFSGVLPLARRGTDVVRYQRLGSTVVDPDEIHLRHPFARTLLDYALGQREALRVAG